MGKLLDLKLQVDHRLLSIVNMWRSLERQGLSREQKMGLKKTFKKSQIKHAESKILICGNGPSLDELDFASFSNTRSVVANFFFKHKSAEVLSPSYYVIIDGKITSGIWPVTMIDEIFEKFPAIELFLDVRWMNLPLFREYKKKDQINWILPNLFPHAYSYPKRRLSQPVCGLNVVASAIGIATSMGYNSLGIAGVDGDGLFREILDRPSHFYHGEKDASMKSFESMVQSLVLSTENLWAWQGIVKNHSREGINIVNLCKGGIMDCMPRVSPNDFLKG